MANHQQRINPSPRNPLLPASSLPAAPSVQGLDVHQSGGSQEIHQEPGTSKNRAKWDHQKRLYLIELLEIHDVPIFRTHNAWSKEAWTGRYVEGSCRGMDHYANKAILPSQVSPDVHLQSPSPSIPAPGSFSFDAEEDKDDTNWFGNDAFTPLGTFMPQETPDEPSSINLAPHVPEQFEETLRHS
ncbi:unnamed protein product [Miscanthus lutarioriparius]|uniref:Uncharacterized protein n=1 Tax=Miscanthus lutarioriparius TaxID=422564 RepID=A0A811ND43_9POAL|nr:unnamed protein product [Miscanthus lutarioriparius]